MNATRLTLPARSLCTLLILLGWGVLSPTTRADLPSVEDLDPPLHTGERLKNLAYRQDLDLMATLSLKRQGSGAEMVIRKISTGDPILAKALAAPIADAFLPADGQEVVVVTMNREKEGLIRRWNLESGEEGKPITMPGRLAYSAGDPSPDGKYFALLGGMTLTIWRLADGKRVLSKKLEPEYKSLTYGLDGRYLLAGRRGGIDKITLPKGEVETTYTTQGMLDAFQVAFTPGQTGFVATCGVRPGYWRIGHWTLDQENAVTISGAIKGDYISRSFRHPTFSPDGKHVSVAGHFGTTAGSLGWGVHFSFPELVETPERIRWDRDLVQVLGFSEDAKHLLAVGKNFVSRLDASSFKLVERYPLTISGRALMKK